MKDMHPPQAIEQLEREAEGLGEGDLRRRCEKLASMIRDLLKTPGPRWVEDNLRLIDRYVFTRPTLESMPADLASDDADHLYALTWLLDTVQHSVRLELQRRFALRPIVATDLERYDETSPRFAVNRTRTTGNSALDWCVAQTVAMGFEWNGTPAVLRPARVDVYRHVEAEREPRVWSVTPPAVACGSRVEMVLRGSALEEVRSAWVGGSRATVTSASEDMVSLQVTVPMAPGPLEVETSSWLDAQVPAIHREGFHGLAVAYEPARLTARAAGPLRLVVECQPSDVLLRSRDEGAPWKARRNPAVRGTWTLDLEPGAAGCVQGVAERRLQVLGGSADGLRDLETCIEEAFTIVVPSDGAHVSPTGGEVRDAGPQEEVRVSPTREEIRVSPALAGAGGDFCLVVSDAQGRRVTVSPLLPGSRIEIALGSAPAGVGEGEDRP